MPSERWNRLDHLFAEAVEQPASTRADFLARTCGGDLGLRDEIASLLNAAAQSPDFLSAPALDVFARQISREGWSVQPGDRIASYTVEERLGSGGMGEVWRARDERLGRDVAIKVLLPHPSNGAERLRAFQQEARAAGTLNHTNVLTVYDIGEHRDAPYLVTECLEGESLRARLGAGSLTVDAALDVALQVARGLGAAHARGIVHRDLKPENIFLVTDGWVKILDFGLATLSESAPLARGLIAGTAGYMAPEQILGEDVDARADIFSLGAVLSEMLTGCRPSNEQANRDIPAALLPIVHRCLATDRDARFATAAELASAIERLVNARNTPSAPGLWAILRQPVVLATVLIVIATMAATGWRWRAAAARVRWARTIAAPEVQRLANRGDVADAYRLVREALDIVPDDPQLTQLWLNVSIPAKVITDPPGADVVFKPYVSGAPNWYPFGRTPLEGIRIPRALFRVRISKPGFLSIEGSASPSPSGIHYRLDPVDAVPAGMVRVVGTRGSIRFGLAGDLDDFWMDRFEVTNRQFKEFVDRGGYLRREYWREPFTEGGRSLSWQEAIVRFRDATGQPGPATWSSGTFPAGQADLPVGGVSWYEAAAYAAFAGKSLPTVYHWYRAAGLGRFADILKVSNFSGTGAAPVGSYDGLGPYGTYDMAGNAKEWCWNETGDRRFNLGGGWNEPRYLYGDYDAKPPFERQPAYGFRLAKYTAPVPAAISGRIRIGALDRDARKEQPVGDAIFDVFRRQYAYDREPLNTVLEATTESAVAVKHTVVIDAAYGHEPMRAHLFLPKNASPPYQTVIFFPASDAFRLQSSRDLSLAWGEAILRSGRAFFYPVYKATYERKTAADTIGANADRELRIAWSRDLGRAIDYLETRTDIDLGRLAFYGVSAGADAGIILTAVEPRLKASVLSGTGIWTDWPPEIDLLNYAPRVRIPTLIVNGRYDFESPFDTAQQPLFALLGTPAEHKRHVVFETGHALPMDNVVREVLPWLDRYLGPVAIHAPAQ